MLKSPRLTDSSAVSSNKTKINFIWLMGWIVLLYNIPHCNNY